MARYQPKLPPADPKAARSWVGKFIRDTRLDALGLVHDISDDANGVRLLARFPGENISRPIALEPCADMEYVLPGDVRARYRPLSETDRAKLAALKAARAAAA